jgi:ssDNA thymidine ADP-ribosyltransferase DarT-like protein
LSRKDSRINHLRLPVAIPTPLRIFHITAICNLASIAKSKALYANTQLLRNKIKYGNIAYQGAQGTRATKLVAKPPGGVIHDYVPFYFAPRSPMLGAINLGKVQDCDYRQPDIVHFETTVEAIVANKLPYVFYDHNATVAIATCYCDVKDLDKIEWSLFFEAPRLDGYCKYWHNVMSNPRYVKRMETRQAEFLVYKSVPLALMSGAGVYNEEKATEVRRIFEEAGIDLRVEAKPSWYF